MVTWIRARINDIGEVALSQRKNLYLLLEIETQQDKHWIYAKLILMGVALAYWKKKLIKYTPIYNQYAYINFYVYDDDSTWQEGYKFDHMVYFIFDRDQLKQDSQGMIDLWLYPEKIDRRTQQMRAMWRKLEQ